MHSVFGLIFLQTTPWIPLWITPLWILAMGLVFGLVGAAAFYAILACLSRIPAVGNLPEDWRKAHIVSAAIGGVIALVGILWTVVINPGGPDEVLGVQTTESHRGFLIVPWIALGLLLGYGFVYGAWRRTAKEIFQIASEGVLGYLLLALGGLAILGLAPSMFAADKADIMNSLIPVLTDDTQRWEVVLPAAPAEMMGSPEAMDRAPFVKRDDFAYDPEIASEVVIKSNRPIMIGNADNANSFTMAPILVEADEPLVWKNSKVGLGQRRIAIPLPHDPQQTGVFFQNRDIQEALVEVYVTTKPPAPQAITIWITGLIVFLLVLSMVTIRQAAPQVSAVALSTAKSELAQPLYIALLLLGAVAIVVFVWVPFNTMGEDIKVLKDSGMTLIMVFSLIQAVWASGTSVSEEIEGRTALTVLSKPISRRSFLIGKYVGIMQTILLMFVLLGMLLLIVTAYKPIYDARENTSEKPPWETCHLEVITTTPGIALLFMETTLIAGISVAIASRLPLMANFIVCFTIYVIGNITASIVRASGADNEIVSFVGKLIAVVIPNLNSFNIQAAVDAGKTIPPIYLAGAFTYLACFGVMILALALLLFEDRDLA